MSHSSYTTLKTLGVALVKERITGTRKGLPNRPNSHHSLRVCEKLEHLSASPTTCLAGLLHDTLEDSTITPSELLTLGFSQEIVDLVSLCSHNPTIENSTARWLLMVANLTTSQNMDAWAIKLTDLSDNLTECSGLSPDNQRFMIETKAPLLLRLTEEYPELEAYRKALEEEMRKQHTERTNPLTLKNKTAHEIDELMSKVKHSDKQNAIGDAFLEALNSVPKSEQY